MSGYCLILSTGRCCFTVPRKPLTSAGSMGGYSAGRVVLPLERAASRGTKEKVLDGPRQYRLHSMMVSESSTSTVTPQAKPTVRLSVWRWKHVGEFVTVLCTV